MGEQDSSLDCLTTAAVWIWWQEKGQSGVLCCWISPAIGLVDVEWVGGCRVGDLGWKCQYLNRGSWESARPGALRVGPSGYSKNFPSGKDLASGGCPALVSGCPYWIQTQMGLSDGWWVCVSETSGTEQGLCGSSHEHALWRLIIGIRILLHRLLAAWPWASFYNSLALNVIIYTMRILITSTL